MHRRPGPRGPAVDIRQAVPGRVHRRQGSPPRGTAPAPADRAAKPECRRIDPAAHLSPGRYSTSATRRARAVGRRIPGHAAIHGAVRSSGVNAHRDTQPAVDEDLDDTAVDKHSQLKFRVQWWPRPVVGKRVVLMSEQMPRLGCADPDIGQGIDEQDVSIVTKLPNSRGLISGFSIRKCIRVGLQALGRSRSCARLANIRGLRSTGYACVPGHPVIAVRRVRLPMHCSG